MHQLYRSPSTWRQSSCHCWSRLSIGGSRPFTKQPAPREAVVFDGGTAQQTRGTDGPAAVNTPAKQARQAQRDADGAYAGRALFRALLRETAFFPDDCARTYMLGQIIKRFRRYHNSELAEALGPEAWYERKATIRRKARQHLHRIERANTGDTKDFARVLSRVYGRSGERRRRLMQEFKMPHPTDEQAVSSSKQSNNRYMPTITPKLRAMIVSQNQALLSSTATSKFKRPGKLQPSIPEFNSWHRPMPQIRVKNMTADWWALLLERVLPPLPVLEWLRLYDLATGATTDIGKAPRTGGVIRYAQDPLEQLATSRNSRLLLWKDTPRDTNFKFAQRAWAEVFASCPLLDLENERWQIIWGYQALRDASIVSRIRANVEHGTAYTFRVAGERYNDRGTSLQP